MNKQIFNIQSLLNGKWIFLFVTGLLTIIPVHAQEAAQLSSGDTAWLLVSTALVLFMVPGLALFYGGMARSKNVLGTLMHSFIALGVMTVQWVVIGYSLAFGEGNSFIGGVQHAFLRGVDPGAMSGTVPLMLFIAFQGTFACITPALIAGAFAERVKFGPYILFIVLWGTLVYDPVCHWVWGGGFLGEDGAIDFAGGTVVHIISGVAGLVAALVLGKRRDFGTPDIVPHNLVFTLAGAGILWFGWFGFNAGSALAADSSAALAMLNTFVAPAGGMLGWLLVEKINLGKPTVLGAASGIVAGLVAITPAAGTVMPVSAIILGFITGAICYFVVAAKHRFKYDDSLDAFGVHGVGGTVGALGCGIFGSVGVNSLLFSGNPDSMPGFEQFWIQFKSVIITGGYSAIVTFLLVYLLEKTIGFRVDEDDENQGLDMALHGERAYNT